MVTENIQTRSAPNQRTYLPPTIGGLGFRSMDVETEIQCARNPGQKARLRKILNTPWRL